MASHVRGPSFGEGKKAVLVGGGSHTDPFFATLLSAVVGLPLVGFVGLSASHLVEPALSRRLAPALWILLAAACALWVFPVFIKIVKIGRRVRARSLALRSLPGPEYGLLGVLKITNQRPDLHRLTTEWTETYGPILRVRFLLFHVSYPSAISTYVRSQVWLIFKASKAICRGYENAPTCSAMRHP